MGSAVGSTAKPLPLRPAPPYRRIDAVAAGADEDQAQEHHRVFQRVGVAEERVVVLEMDQEQGHQHLEEQKEAGRTEQQPGDEQQAAAEFRRRRRRNPTDHRRRERGRRSRGRPRRRGPPASLGQPWTRNAAPRPTRMIRSSDVAELGQLSGGRGGSWGIRVRSVANAEPVRSVEPAASLLGSQHSAIRHFLQVPHRL